MPTHRPLMSTHFLLTLLTRSLAPLGRLLATRRQPLMPPHCLLPPRCHLLSPLH